MNTTTNHKPIFDTVRRMLGRGFRQAEVDALDAALDQSAFSDQDSVPCVPSVQAEASQPECVSAAGIALIKRFEGCARLRRDGLVEAYPDPASGGEPWTVGWGATGPDHFNGGRIGPGTVWTQEQCDLRLERDLARYAAEVAQAIGETTTSQSQFDAMVSFHYNTGAIHRATLTRRHISGDFASAGSEFHRWNRAAGRVLKGLTRRRQAEANLYLQG